MEKNVFSGAATQPPKINVLQKNNTSHLSLSGNWTVLTLSFIISDIEKIITSLSSKSVVIDLDSIQELDTAGALIVNRFKMILEKKGSAVSLIVESQNFLKLLNTSVPVGTLHKEASPSRPLPSPLFWINRLGKEVTLRAEVSASLLNFFGQFLLLTFSSLRKPLSIRWTSFFFFIEQVGLRAVPIVTLLSVLIGVVVAYMCMDELAKFGAQSLTIKLLEVSMFREMGILITAIVVAGRSSSSFTAQIGSMVANEEVAAIRAMGLDPLSLLVLPRVMALVVCLPLLVFVSDVAGVLGGALAICPAQDISFTGFLSQFYEGSKIWNFYVALIKAPFCALAIGLIGSFQGFQATSSSESVGFLTTISVVQSIFFVIVIDAIFAIFFAGLGI